MSSFYNTYTRSFFYDVENGLIIEVCSTHILIILGIINMQAPSLKLNLIQSLKPNLTLTPVILRSLTLNPSPVLFLNLTLYPRQIWITLCLDIAKTRSAGYVQLNQLKKWKTSMHVLQIVHSSAVVRLYTGILKRKSA